MGDKGERGVKNLKKWLTSFMKVQYIENINPSDAVAALDLERRPKCIPNGLLCDKPYKNIW